MTSMPSLEPDVAVAVNTPRPPLLKRLILLTLAIAVLVLSLIHISEPTRPY